MMSVGTCVLIFYILFFIIYKFNNISRLHLFGGMASTLFYFSVFIGFERLLGNSPVNLFGQGSHDGIRNLIFNIFVYGSISFLVTLLGLFLIQDKRRFFLAVLVGSFSVSIYSIFYIMIYFAYFW